MIFVRIEDDHARHLMKSMVGVKKWDTSDGLKSFDELMQGGAAFLAMVDSVPMMVFIIQKIKWAYGRELFVKAAWQLGGGRDLTRETMPLIIERFGFDCDAVTVVTRRGGLVRKLEKQGFAKAATIMRKMLK
jgi:hypothetical protein